MMLLEADRYTLSATAYGPLACDFATSEQGDHAATRRVEYSDDEVLHVCDDPGCRQRLFDRTYTTIVTSGPRPPIRGSVRTSPSNLRAFVDGDQIAIVGPDFVDLQESDVIAWIPTLQPQLT